MPLPEVAASLAIPTGTAKSRLHYALAQMRVSVTGHDDAARGGANPADSPDRVPGGQLA
jgi:DNA-directed RNA polymerase specialized sigma24 family protein